jgi:hypothetical protein
MSCCSGSSQAKQLIFTMKFRPFPEREYTLATTLLGQNGNWTGQATGTFDFGTTTELGCGCDSAYGQQTVTATVRIICADGSSPAAQGHITISFDHSTHRAEIPYVPFNCINGGPSCSARWDLIFLGRLGNVNLSIHNP